MTSTRCNVLLVCPRFHGQSFWNMTEACEIFGADIPAPPLGLITVAALLPPSWECRLVNRNTEELTEADLAWDAGSRHGLFEAEKFKIDITKTPIPRYDLLKREQYVYYSVQFARGCPFTCEFCDIIELYGRVPRVKTIEQILAEIETIYRLGYRGHLDFVDDNFIGNKKAVKNLLPHLIAWQQERGYPFKFSTEASINLADDDALLALMQAANFFTVFVGIESPDPAT